MASSVLPGVLRHVRAPRVASGADAPPPLRTGAFTVEILDAPVGDCKQVILKVSASITSTPELPGTGEMRDAMAWMLWKVLARTRYSFEVRATRRFRMSSDALVPQRVGAHWTRDPLWSEPRGEHAPVQSREGWCLPA